MFRYDPDFVQWRIRNWAGRVGTGWGESDVIRNWAGRVGTGRGESELDGVVLAHPFSMTPPPLGRSVALLLGVVPGAGVDHGDLP